MTWIPFKFLTKTVICHVYMNLLYKISLKDFRNWVLLNSFRFDNVQSAVLKEKCPPSFSICNDSHKKLAVSLSPAYSVRNFQRPLRSNGFYFRLCSVSDQRLAIKHFDLRVTAVRLLLWNPTGKGNHLQRHLCVLRASKKVAETVCSPPSGLFLLHCKNIGHRKKWHVPVYIQLETKDRECYYSGKTTQGLE